MSKIDENHWRSATIVWASIATFVATAAGLLSNWETIQKYIPKQLAMAKWTTEDLEETTWNNNFVQEGCSSRPLAEIFNIPDFP